MGIDTDIKYTIKSSTLKSIADQARRISGTTDGLTLDGMIKILKGVEKSENEGVSNEIARLYTKGEYIPYYTVGLGEACNYTPIYFGGEGIAGFCESAVYDVSTWSKNGAASSAYTSIDYTKNTNENKCTFVGKDGYELLYFKKTLKAGKTYVFSLDYYSSSDVVGEYEEPYAPFIGFFQNENTIFTNNVNAYKFKYATTLLPVGTMTGYKSYQCSYTPTSDLNDVLVGFSTGCTLDGVETIVYLKNITLTEEK